MLRIDRNLDTRSIESAYEQLENNKPDLFITKKISEEFGMVPAIIQLISTWFKKVPNGNIMVDSSVGDDLKLFYDLDYFFPAITHCWSRKIVDNSNNDLKPTLRQYNAEAYRKMTTQQAGGGQKVLLSCFDHLSKKRGLLNAFYVDGEFIDSEIIFGMSIDKALKQVVSFNKQKTKNLSNVYLDLIDIIYELIKNTDNWATTDEQNRPLVQSSRGLYMKFHKKKQTTLMAEFQEQEGIRNYFSTSKFEENSQGEVYFLELSVFDTGIGFVQRYRPTSVDKPYSSAEQVEIVKECLLVNNTSAVGLSQMVKGKGLDRIMSILNKKGFFWLRTGSVSLYRNLRQNQYFYGGGKEDVVLYDWKTNSSEKFAHLESVVGSVVSLVYPISALLNE
ncbi:hypothetical protein ABIB40_000224 [Pedobacter sp. UYP30]|uniref:hypothetical protein n=1 Tax=Pedobacter sp. UYP30 TaxID=1756400 RepID=UPI0033935E21